MTIRQNLFRRLRPTLPRIGILVAGLHGVAIVQTAFPDAPRPPDQSATAAPLTELKVIERVTTATDRALDYLEQKQIKDGPETGSWHTNQAFNALAMLAFMSNGHAPVRG